MAKSRGRKFAELIAPSNGVFAADSLPTIALSKLASSTFSVNSESASLGGNVVLDSNDITEHTSALYFTNARADTRADARIAAHNLLARAGGTMTGNLTLGDNVNAYFGASTDLRIYHDGTNSHIINSTGELRFTGSNFAIKSDSAKLYFGLSDDLQIYHDGSNSYVTDAGTGNLVIGADTFIYIGNPAGTTTAARFNAAGAQVFNHNNSQKLSTTSTGIDVTGVITTDGMTTSADINFGDNDKAVFGAGSDLQIYHDGTDSFIKEGNNTGSLKIWAKNFEVYNADGSETLIDANVNSAVQLYHDNSLKFATTSTGIDVTGTVTANGLQIDGAATITQSAGSNFLKFDVDGTTDEAILGIDSTDFIIDIDPTNVRASSNFVVKNDGTTNLTLNSSGDLDVNGTVTADGLTVDGVANFNANNINYTGSSPKFNFFENDATDVNTQLVNTVGDFYIKTVSDDAGTTTNRFSLDHATGDISFYEDTGTTPKLTWDASDEDLKFADLSKAVFGAGSDLQIYHDGSNSYITDAGTGDLIVRGANIEIQTGGGNRYFTGQSNVARLYHTDNEKLRTTSTGVQTTGTLNVNGAYTLPTSDGSANQVLQTDGSGTLSFATVSGGAGGDITAVVAGTNLSGGATSGSATINLATNLSGLGTIGSGAITSTGKVKGASLETDRYVYHAGDTNTYIDFGTDSISFHAGAGAGSERLIISSSATNIASGTVQIGGTTVIDTSRNLTNIGTIGSGAITSTGQVQGSRLKIDVPDNGSAPALTAYMDIYGFEGRGAGIKIRDQANSASGSSNREWFIGSGYSQSGFNIGYSATGSQTSYSAQNKFSLDTSGNAVIAGTISSGAITSTGRGTFNNLTLTGATDHLTFNESSGDWTINNAQQNNGITIFDGTGGVAINYNGSIVFEVKSTGGANLVSGGFKIAGTGVIDSSRNLTNIGTISSGAITTTGSLFVDAPSGNPDITLKTAGAGNNPLIRIQAATNYWDIQTIFSNTDDELDFRYNGTSKLEIDKNGNATFAGTISSGSITTSGDISIPVAQGLYFGGGNHTYISEDTDNRLRFFTGGSEFMRFTQSVPMLDIYQPVHTNSSVTIDVDNEASGALRIEANQTNPNNDFYFAQEIVSTLSGTTATTGDREQGGIYMDINATTTAGDTSNEHRAYGIYIDLDVTGDSDVVYGAYVDATATPTTGQVSSVVGGFFRGEDNGGAGAVSNIYGVQGYATSDNSASDTNNMYGGFFYANNTADSAAVGASHGVYAEVQIDATADILGTTYVYRAEYDNNSGVAQTNSTYLFYGNYAGTLPTNAYGVYIADAVRNYFGGTLTASLGSTTTASYGFNGDLNTGMYSPANHQVAFLANGTNRLNLNSSGAQVTGSVTATGSITATAALVGASADISGSVAIGTEVVLSESTDRADLLQITGTTSTWAGLQIRNSSNEGRWSFMTDGAIAGIYDDENNDWYMQFNELGATEIFHNSSQKLTTSTTGVSISGNIDAVTDIYLADQILHTGDTDTYIQFHAANQFRVVTGGGERLEVNQGTTTIAGTLNVRQAIDLADSDYLRLGSGDDAELFCNGSHLYLDLNSGIGNFYIRDGTTTRYTFNDNGNFTATGNITAYSDRRVKRDFEPIENALEKISQLEGMTYIRTDMSDGNRRYAGLIAQDVEKVLPEAVHEVEDHKVLDYNGTIGLLVEAIKELKEEVASLKTQLKEK